MEKPEYGTFDSPKNSRSATNTSAVLSQEDLNPTKPWSSVNQLAQADELPPKEDFSAKDPLLGGGRQRAPTIFEQAVGTTKLLIATGIATTGASFQFGYQMAILNNGAKPIQRFINQSLLENYDYSITASQMNVLWSWYTGSMMLGAMLGSVFGFLLNYIGRRKGLIAAGMTFVLGIVPSIIAYPTNRFELLIISRTMIGIAVGFSTVAQASYITEIAPSHLRGRMNSFIGLMIRSGYLIGTLLASNRACGADGLWVYLFVAEAIICTIHTVAAIFVCVETPNFLLYKNNEKDAIKSIKMFHGSQIDLKKTLEKIRADVDMKKSTLSFWTLLQTPVVRLSLLHACILGIGSTLSGINGLTTYSATLLAKSGFDADARDLITIGLGISGIVGCFVLGYFVETLGRRSLLLIGITTCLILDIAIWILLVMVDNQTTPSNALPITFACVEIFYMFIFCTGYGPVAQFIAVEMVPLEARSATQSIVSVFLYFGVWLSQVIFIPLEGIIGGHAFVMFTIPTAFSLIYVSLFLPETKNRPTSDVLEDVAAGNVFRWKKRNYEEFDSRDVRERVTSIASSVVVF